MRTTRTRDRPRTLTTPRLTQGPKSLLDLHPKHLLYAALAFTIGYGVSILVTGERASLLIYSAGMVGSIIGYLIVAWALE